jgi:hypothetical protein
LRLETKRWFSNGQPGGVMAESPQAKGMTPSETKDKTMKTTNQTPAASASRKYYTTIGSVRGCCGHHHRTIAAAEMCLTRDQRGCKSQGGYSDRRVVDQDGNGVEVSNE